MLVDERFWVVFDSVEGTGQHQIESRFQFAPGKVSVTGATARTLFDDANLLLVAAPLVGFTDIQVQEGQQNPRQGWYSDSYNKIEPAPALAMSLCARLPWRSATLLYPYRGQTPPPVTFTFDGHSAQIQLPRVRKVDCTIAGPP